MATSLTQLRARARYYNKDSGGTTWANAELDQYIDDAQRWLWSQLVKEEPSFGLRETTFDLTQAQINYAYPSDCLGRNISEIYVYDSSTDPWHEVKKAGLREVVAEGTAQTPYPYKWVPLDGYFQIGPPPDASGYTMRVFYNRQPTALADAADNMDSDDEFAEVIALEAAIRCHRTNSMDAAHLKDLRDELLMESVGLVKHEGLLQAALIEKYKE